MCQVCQIDGLEQRKEELKKRLQITDSCSEEGRRQLEDLLLEHNSVFALEDKELGEQTLLHTALIQAMLNLSYGRNWKQNLV